MRLRTILLSALLLSLVLGAGNTAVNPTMTQIDTTTVVVANAADAITVPGLLSYQGKLTDNNGNPVIDTTYSVTFRLYVVPSGGSPFWNETQSVQTNAGLFSVLLGSVTQIPSVPDAGALYLGMQVGTSSELTPRLRIVSSAYSYLAKRADSANYAASAPPTRPITPPITTGEIAANAVTNCAHAYEAGVARSWSSSTAWQTIPNMSVTVTTTGGPVLIMYSGGSFSNSWNNYDGLSVSFGLFRGGTLIATQVGMSIYRAFGTYDVNGCENTFIHTDIPAAGTYTYDIRLLWSDFTLHQNYWTPRNGSNSLTVIELRR
jgi:hypothetical protein